VANRCSVSLAKLAVARGAKDDISVVIVDLNLLFNHSNNKNDSRKDNTNSTTPASNCVDTECTPHKCTAPTRTIAPKNSRGHIRTPLASSPKPFTNTHSLLSPPRSRFANSHRSNSPLKHTALPCASPPLRTPPKTPIMSPPRFTYTPDSIKRVQPPSRFAFTPPSGRSKHPIHRPLATLSPPRPKVGAPRVIQRLLPPSPEEFIYAPDSGRRGNNPLASPLSSAASPPPRFAFSDSPEPVCSKPFSPELGGTLPLSPDLGGLSAPSFTRSSTASGSPTSSALSSHFPGPSSPEPRGQVETLRTPRASPFARFAHSPMSVGLSVLCPNFTVFD
jgi:hypothetical protein